MRLHAHRHVLAEHESRYTTLKIHVAFKQYPALENNASKTTKSISCSLPVRHRTPRQIVLHY